MSNQARSDKAKWKCSSRSEERENLRERKKREAEKVIAHPPHLFLPSPIGEGIFSFLCTFWLWRPKLIVANPAAISPDPVTTGAHPAPAPAPSPTLPSVSAPTPAVEFHPEAETSPTIPGTGAGELFALALALAHLLCEKTRACSKSALYMALLNPTHCSPTHAVRSAPAA